MNPKNKRTLFLTSTICIILSIVAFALSHMGGASNENYILLYVIAVLLNIVLNLALSIKIASTNGAKALVSLGKWIMPIAGVVYLIPQVYSVLFPAKTMQDTYWYVFIGILFIVSGNYFPKNHINLGWTEDGEDYAALTADNLPLGNVYGFSENLLNKMDIIEGESDVSVLKEKLWNSDFFSKSEWGGGERHRGQGSGHAGPMFRLHRDKKAPGQQKAIRAQKLQYSLTE